MAFVAVPVQGATSPSLGAGVRSSSSPSLRQQIPDNDACGLLIALVSSVSIVLVSRGQRRMWSKARSRTVMGSKPEADVEERLREVESTMSMDSDEDNILQADLEGIETQKGTAGLRYSETRSLPRFLFLREPDYRAFAANVPGDLGFDPLGLCTDVRKFVEYREAELKHGRLAMFAAVAWPLAEIVDESIVGSDSNAVDFLAETGGKMLPQLGENDTFVEVFAAIVLAIGGAVELFRGEGKDGNEPGDSGFDPLRLKSWRPPTVFRTFLPENRPWMGEAEIQHSRLAMLAVLYDILVEFFTPNPVVEDTEYIFHRIDAKLLRWDYWALQPSILDAGPDVQI
ncbi:FCP [Symbiodinium microadriaticum]|nr:FCP [Symbiodinium microadriaticum]CAE7944503.1 FCP [Symbiodinium sp. KB8]